MSNCYIEEVEKLDPDYGSSSGNKVHIIFDGGAGVVLRAFKSMKELGKFADTLGFSYRLMVSTMTDRCGKHCVYRLSHFIDDPHFPPRYFWSLAELPPGVQKVTLMENGSDVTCYFINDGKVIHIFRPNCNAKEVYKIY